MLPNRTEDFTRDGAVAGVGKRAHRFGKLGRDTGGYRDFPLAVYLVRAAHILFFGYEDSESAAARIQAPLPLQLWDIDDAERFCSAIVSRSGFQLSFHDAEDLRQHLLVEAWRLSLSYQAGGISFSTWAGNTLRRRSVDWIRQQNGRTIWRFGDGRVHERPRRELVSFDDDAERDRMDLALGTESGDPAADCDPDRERLLGDGSRSRARDYALLGLEPPRRAA